MSEHETIQSDQKKRQAMKSMIAEITNHLQLIDDERAKIKDIAEACEDKFDVKKKFINKMARVMYKHSYADVTSENEHFEILYENIIEGRSDGEE